MSTPHVILWDPGNFVGGSVQFGSDLGPFEFGGNLYCVTAVYDVNTLDSTLQIHKSVDGGVTWAEQDPTNAPAEGISYVFDGTDTFYLVHGDGGGNLVVKAFDCNTDTFGADSVSGPAYTLSGHPAITVAVQVLSTGTVVCGYRPFGGGFNIVELVAGVWGTPAVVSATSFELIMGSVLCPGDVVYFLVQQYFPTSPRTVSSYEWASGAVGSPVHISDMDTSFDEWTLNGDDTTMSFPGLYSSSLNAMLFALYNYSDPSDFKLTLLVGTLGSPVTWSVIPGPTAPNMASSGNVNPRLALNADESILYMSLNQLADTGVDGVIWLWSSTDGGNTWDGPTELYNYESNPPTPPPTTIDAIESPTLHVLANGDVSIITGLSTSPTFIFCGVNYYFTSPVIPPPHDCGDPIQVSSDAQFRQSASEINPDTFDMGTYLYQVLVASQGEAKIGVFKRLKSDIVGAWVEQDSSNSPDNTTQSGFLNVVQNGTILAILYLLDDGVSLKIVEFETATDLYGTPTGAATVPSSAGRFGFFLRSGVYTVIGAGGGLGTYYLTNTGGTWGAVTNIMGAPDTIQYGGFVDTLGNIRFFYNQVSAHLEERTLSPSFALSFAHTYTNNLDFAAGTPTIAQINPTSYAVGYIITATGRPFLATIVTSYTTAPVYTPDTVYLPASLDESVSYGRLAVDSSGTLTAFFVRKNIVSVPVVNEIDKEIRTSSWTGFQTFYDYVANPPSGGPSDTSQVIRDLQPLNLLTGWAMSLTLNTVSGMDTLQTGFYIDSCGTVVQTLQLNKEVVGGSLSAADFTLTATGSDSPTTVVTGPGPQVGPTAVPAITFDLSESYGPTWDEATGTWAANTSTWDGGYTAGVWVCTGGGTMPDDHTIIIPAGANIVCTIVNTAPIPPIPPQPGSPCGGPITPHPATDVQFELRRVYASMKPAPRIPVRGS